MPVVVASAATELGHAVVSALLDLGAEVEVRATVPSIADRLWFLERGVPVAVTDLHDAELLAAVLAGAHTLVLVDGSSTVASQAGVILEAIADSDLTRLVVVGALGALRPPAGLEVIVVPVEPEPLATAAAVLAADSRRSG